MEPTKRQNYKYETKEMALAAAKRRKNRARKDRRRCAKQHLTAAQKMQVPQADVKQGRTREDKMKARREYRKVIKRAKQQRRRRQVVNRQIWKELRAGLPKMEEEATSSTQPANPVQDTSVHLTGSDDKTYKQADQHWLAIEAENAGTLNSVERAVIDGILFKVTVSISGRRKIGLIDSGASRCYMSPETAMHCELSLNQEILHLELADGSKVQSTQRQ